MDKYKTLCSDSGIRLLNNVIPVVPHEIAKLRSFGYTIRDDKGIWIATSGSDVVVYIPEHVTFAYELPITGVINKLTILGGANLELVRSLITDLRANTIDVSHLQTSNMKKVSNLFFNVIADTIIIENKDFTNVERLGPLFHRCTVGTLILNNLKFNDTPNLSISELFIGLSADSVIINNVADNVYKSFSLMSSSVIRNLQISNINIKKAYEGNDRIINSTKIDNLKVYKCKWPELYFEIRNTIMDDNSGLLTFVCDEEVEFNDNSDKEFSFPVTFEFNSNITIMCKNMYYPPTKVNSSKAYPNFTSDSIDGAKAFADCVYTYVSTTEVECHIPSYVEKVEILPPPCETVRLIGGENIKYINVVGLDYSIDTRELATNNPMYIAMRGTFTDVYLHPNTIVHIFGSRYDTLDLSDTYMLSQSDFDRRVSPIVQIKNLFLPDIFKEGFEEFSFPQGYSIDCIEFPGENFKGSFDKALNKLTKVIQGS